MKIVPTKGERVALTSYLQALVAQEQALFSSLLEAGARPIFVGGVIRDFFLGRPTKDIDIEVHDLPEEDLQEILKKDGRFTFAGKSFGVYTAPGLELSLPRLEQKTGPRHRDFSVEVNKDLSFAEAARRRDLTLNAMGYDWALKTFLDPYGGYADLKSGLLRAVNTKTFREDELRVLRVAGFMARFQMNPDETLLGLCRQADLSPLSPMRIGGELKKILYQGQKPSMAFAFLEQTGLVHQLFLSKYAPQAFERMGKEMDALVQIFSGEKRPEKALALLGTLLWYAPQMEAVSKYLIDLTFGKEDVQKSMALVAQTRFLCEEAFQEEVTRAPLKEAAYQLFLKKIPLNLWKEWLACSYDAKRTRLGASLEDYDMTQVELPLVTASMLMERGISQGPTLGAALKACRLLQYEKELRKAEEVLQHYFSK